MNLYQRRSNASTVPRSSPVTRPYERAASPLSVLLFVPTWTERSCTHPKGSSTVHARLFGEHSLAWLVMFAVGRNGLREELSPGLLRCFSSRFIERGQ